MYLLYKEEMKANHGGEVDVETLYHVTSPTNAKQIARQNID